MSPYSTEDASTLPLHRDSIYIDGAFVHAQSQVALDVFNPADGTSLGRLVDSGAHDVDAAVSSSRRAFESPRWKGIGGSKRRDMIWRLGDLISENALPLAKTESKCNGKLLSSVEAELKVIPDYYRFFAGLADKITGEAMYLPDKPDTLNYVTRDPLGVIAVIIPWNSPSYDVCISVGPALAAGNTVVLKPSEFASLSVIEAMPLFEQAGFPPGVVNLVTGGSGTGSLLAGHALVDKVCFTGGTATGRQVARAAAENLTVTQLELGGKSPQVVFEDADMEGAINGIIAGIVASGGQTCVAGSRLLVQETIIAEFLERLSARFRQVRIGDPADPETQLGPLANAKQLQRVSGYVDIGRQEGAQVVCGGSRPEDGKLADGYYYLPTIMSNVTPKMRVWQEEIFGPVLCTTTFRDEGEAIRLANETRYGLAAGVWTRDIHRGHRVARAIQAGTVWLNMYRAFSYASPYGGFKESGYGRELGTRTLQEFTQTKSIWVELESRTRDPLKLG